MLVLWTASGRIMALCFSNLTRDSVASSSGDSVRSGLRRKQARSRILPDILLLTMKSQAKKQIKGHRFALAGAREGSFREENLRTA